MLNGSFRVKPWGCALVIALVFCLYLADEGFSQDNDPHMTGLPELTPEELEWQNTHMLRTRKVRLNELGLERINKARAKRGLMSFTWEKADVVPIGKEVEGFIGYAPPPEPSEELLGASAPPMSLPASVDNSTLKYFPPIRSQSPFPSCGVFSGTYYAMTHMYAFARDLDAKDGGDSYRLSPKWTYNMVNGGELVGSWYYWAYDIGLKHGIATWAEFPYDSDYRAWSLTTSVWRDSIDRRFDRYGYVDYTYTDYSINMVKQMLVNGYVFNIATYIYSWQSTAIGDDPATTEDDAFVGESCCYWVNGYSGYHAMTVVGYNDHIWVDVNANGVVDTGEKGAFRIANSWGTGWWEDGFGWMAYDALKNPSAVAGGPSTDRIYGWQPYRAHWVTARPAYDPVLVAEFTVNHLKRDQLRIALGISETTESVPTTTWYPEMIYFQGGPYAFDGTTTACDGTFVFDFSDIAPTGVGEKRFYLRMYDYETGDIAELKNYKLIDVYNGGTEPVCSAVPMTADEEEVLAYIDHDFPDWNRPPVLNPIGYRAVDEGQTLSFTVTASDPDGTTPALSATGLPDNSTFTDHADGTGTFTWNTDYTDEGMYDVYFEASDGVLTDGEDIDITVYDAARACQFLQWIPSFGITSAPELARVGINYGNSRVMAQVKDASTDTQIKQVFFTLNFEPISLAVLPDFGGTSVPELACLGRRASDGCNLAHVADASSGALLKRVYFHAEFLPYDMEWMPDFGQTSAPELVVLARRASDTAIMGAKRDASSRFLVNPRTWFAATFLPVDIEIMGDIDANGVDELVSLQQRPTDDEITSEVRDASTNVLIQRVWFGTLHNPLDVEVVTDFGGGSSAPELAMLGQTLSSGAVEAVVRDSSADDLISTVSFSNSYSPVDIEVVSDFGGGSSAPELVVLSYDPSTDAVAGEVRDASTGTLINTVSFDSDYRPKGIEVLTSFGAGGTSAPELAVHGVNPSDGSVIGEIKDASSGDPVSICTFSKYFVIP